MSFTGALRKAFSGTVQLIGGVAIVGGPVQLAQRDLAALSAVQGDGTAQDTSIDLPADSVVERVILDIDTAEATGATKTLDVGHAGNGTEFASGLDVSATGLVVESTGNGVADQSRTVTITAGSADFAELEGDIVIEYRVMT